MAHCHSEYSWATLLACAPAGTPFVTPSPNPHTAGRGHPGRPVLLAAGDDFRDARRDHGARHGPLRRTRRPHRGRRWLQLAPAGDDGGARGGAGEAGAGGAQSVMVGRMVLREPWSAARVAHGFGALFACSDLAGPAVSHPSAGSSLVPRPSRLFTPTHAPAQAPNPRPPCADHGV